MIPFWVGKVMYPTEVPLYGVHLTIWLIKVLKPVIFPLLHIVIWR